MKSVFLSLLLLWLPVSEAQKADEIVTSEQDQHEGQQEDWQEEAWGEGDWGEDSWEEDDWEDESPYQLSHELSYGYAYLTNSDSVNFKNSIQNEFRSKSLFKYQTDKYTFNFELELYADALIDKYQIEPYELNFFFPIAGGTDIKIGRQVITWGTGDLLFLNDLFPKDWQSFFNGRNDSYLKPPVDAIRFSHYGELMNFEVALMPEFEADKFLTGERYSFYIPGAGIIQPPEQPDVQKENNPELSVRLFGNRSGIEWALYAYRGYFKSPSAIDQTGKLGFNKMYSSGASLRMPLAGGLFNGEVVYYQSKDDKSGVEPFIRNSQSRYLLGFEKEIASDITMAVQAYVEKTHDYQSLLDNLLPGQLVPVENRTMLTTRLTHKALQQLLLNSFMLFYSPSDDDYYVRYSSRYTINDQWKAILGLNLLNGTNEETFLGQFQDNSNVFFRIQYAFEQH